MLDAKFVRTNPDVVREALRKRHVEANLDEFLQLDEKRRQLLAEVEQLKAMRNKESGEIARLKKAGQPADERIAAMRKVSEKIKGLDDEVRQVEEELNHMLMFIPNVPHDSVPEGTSDADNVVVSTWGEPRKFDFEPKAHWDIGTDLDILDFERAGKVTGARFTFYKGLGARLERACMNFMLDLHLKQGYTEIFPPFICNGDSMTGTGQLPKFKEDMFKLEGLDYYLIPTAEVPVTNIHREEIIDGDKLPLHYVAYSACFRAEAGSAGRDTRGLIRQHQFNKVELVKFCSAETSWDELEKLTNDAEEVLQLLGLSYRKVVLSTGDLGFSSAKTYDLEVWLPSYGTYKEISSCSNFLDFQARRAGIRYRPAPKAKAEYAHTLNGSGVAVGRTVAAVLENYQQADGSVVVPEALRPYMGGAEVIK
ncbi:MAG TPA: serine--tRNA ligase [Firmicutes bacterium]|nr:serine--tRNA ligase [Bacillota bacterium]